MPSTIAAKKNPQLPYWTTTSYTEEKSVFGYNQMLDITNSKLKPEYMEQKGLVIVSRRKADITKAKNEIGFEANSDGDVILHALFNALSTAIGGKSLGFYADKMFKDGITDSKKYLEFILNKVKERNYKISNVAIMLEGKRPRIDGYIDKIKASLSKILNKTESSAFLFCMFSRESIQKVPWLMLRYASSHFITSQAFLVWI